MLSFFFLKITNIEILIGEGGVKMYYSKIKSVDISKCILCHDAVCTKACPTMDPARIIRALRFDNAAGASMMLPKEDICLHCDGKC